MSAWTKLRLPAEHDMLVGFYDLTGYTAFAEHTEPLALLDLLAGYFTLTGDIIAAAGGRLIKTLGDAGLFAFFAADADAGIAALKKVESEGGAWLTKKGYRCGLIVKVNFGPVAIGMVGGRGSEILDVYGKTVNTAAVLPGRGMTLTPAAFRALSPASRKLFKKHTPPVSYIGAGDKRP